MEPATLQITVLAIASLLAAAAAVAAFLRAFGAAGTVSDTQKPTRGTQILWALVPLVILGSVLLAMVKADG